LWGRGCVRGNNRVNDLIHNDDTAGDGSTGVWRIVDAELNRCAEGLRVVEEYLRMVLEDPHLAGRAKHLRHQLIGFAANLPSLDRLASRDTLGDVGRQLKTESETQRHDPWHVAQASFSRVAQGLRALEEYGKLIDIGFASECEALRYELYTLEKAAGLTFDSVTRLQNIQLCGIVGGQKSRDEFVAEIRRLVEGGIGMVQLRDKNLNDVELLVRARALVSETRGSDTLAIINDRADVAAAAGADGVHLGQDDFPLAAARRIVGSRAVVGRSTHSIDQARQAVLQGANYLGVGPTFPSATKRFDQYPGLELLRQVASEIRLPAFAIGGIKVDNLPQVLATGIRRVAVAGALESPAAAALLLERLRQA
jgi:thiamine-phosphate pyrophosphorylase